MILVLSRQTFDTFWQNLVRFRPANFEKIIGAKVIFSNKIINLNLNIKLHKLFLNYLKNFIWVIKLYFISILLIL